MTKDLNKISDKGWFRRGRIDIEATAGIYHQCRVENPDSKKSWRANRPATAEDSGPWSRPE